MSAEDNENQEKLRSIFKKSDRGIGAPPQRVLLESLKAFEKSNRESEPFFHWSSIFKWAFVPVMAAAAGGFYVGGPRIQQAIEEVFNSKSPQDAAPKPYASANANPTPSVPTSVRDQGGDAQKFEDPKYYSIENADGKTSAQQTGGQLIVTQATNSGRTDGLSGSSNKSLNSEKGNSGGLAGSADLAQGNTSQANQGNNQNQDQLKNTPPAAPTDLRLEIVQNSGELLLSWTNGAQVGAQNSIEISGSGTNFSPIGQVSGAANQFRIAFKDLNFNPELTTSFRVLSKTNNLTSTPSNLATLAPLTPKALNVRSNTYQQDASHSGVMLTWVNSSTDEHLKTEIVSDDGVTKTFNNLERSGFFDGILPPHSMGFKLTTLYVFADGSSVRSSSVRKVQCTGDVNNSGWIDQDDLAAIGAAVQGPYFSPTTTSRKPEDINGNKNVEGTAAGADYLLIKNLIDQNNGQPVQCPQ